MKAKDFEVKTLGECTVKSPLGLAKEKGERMFDFISDDLKVLYNVTYKNSEKGQKQDLIAFEKAGPRENLFFDPSKTKAAIVTCGGLCPGINNVIRSIVMGLYYRYKVTNVVGVRYGYQGFIPKFNIPFIELTPQNVGQIHQFGGSVLASSRGQQDVGEIVDALVRNNINILFTIGGDGTLKGAQAISDEIEKRGLKISVVGIPKTIDNDINLVEKSFGFETAFTMANPIIRDAHNEAKGAYNGIAIVKLMGRDSGFIAAHAALSMPDVNFVLVPEIRFDLYGKNGFLESLRKRLDKRHHALIVVAEGAGQYFFEDEKEKQTDASGNVRYDDIGIYLKNKINDYFKGEDVTVKYIDPSYIIRSAPANASDSVFCSRLALNAVHGAMAGKTGFVASRWNNQFVYLPIPVAVKERKKIDLAGELWWNVLEATGQPPEMRDL
ncbi:ATP-dependent 6-phosphofructokinase [Flammeovirgaceae bacterium SG7u.111]|nr:ATP-dependent 6-phosphofructokinase [Flammeovirgaceae bacterium SG7u.132]WPO34143.1 ATP-dependent 6-phosphofructokinase [Flammeovirgaceae bacterium SG7u.111]